MATGDLINVGEKFSSFAELQSRIDQYERLTFLNVYKRSSLTISAAIKQTTLAATKITDERENTLKHYSLRYACVHGGRKLQSKSTGRRKVSTLIMDCPFVIKVRLSDEKKHLEICHSNLTHENHEPDKTSQQFTQSFYLYRILYYIFTIGKTSKPYICLFSCLICNKRLRNR